MKVFISVDAHLYRTPDNRIWTKTIYGYEFWKRYLETFSNIIVLSRIDNVAYEFVEGFLLSSGDNVDFWGVPLVRSAKDYIIKLPNFVKKIKNLSNDVDCAIFRLPSITSFIAEIIFSKQNKPYVLEVVADPETVYEENKIVKYIMTKHLKKACLRANGVSYVTKYALQKLYPSKNGTLNKSNYSFFESYYSSINLSEKFFSSEKNFDKISEEINLIHTANNINNYIKGHDTAIKIVKSLRDRGINANITFIGDGLKKAEFLTLAESLGIQDYVNFTGFLSSKSEIRNKLLDSDLFLFPTHAEGLPRAIIEAMAVGLPCLSTPVNGIPELLEMEFLFNPDDVEAFSDKIMDLVNNKNKLSQMSRDNILKAKEYENSVLQKRRNDFYIKLINIVNWEKKDEN
ncbi:MULTISPECIES: glycosyltransferase [unclassified Facklamia]|uniref:glycosyltransferase n=1 Tax=Aerococcaceae TaxID=186827 RepID=UPI0013BE5818|nr:MULTISPECIES: glycosyltransferase [unclassified Facklamia]MBS4462467.1 glycosyltransferase family 4 protein [Aerococcaceae bacterium zg-B36]NEW65054.1 glycosyltransferase [Facklamia sp. 252]NEW68711.1 glycosyltransferase [Facklamia sp. 253]QQD65119.1 glycosyltransferase family 4 protein [Aerococcaceae bacterium zg-252]